MFDVRPYKDRIAEMCTKLGIQRFEIFGSAVTDDFNDDSDIDCLIEFSSEVGNHFDRYFELKYELEAMLGRKVDIVVDTAIKNPYFRLAVNSSRKLVYAA
jgi:predicted nucleotidyltransferase